MHAKPPDAACFEQCCSFEQLLGLLVVCACLPGVQKRQLCTVAEQVLVVPLFVFLPAGALGLN